MNFANTPSDLAKAAKHLPKKESGDVSTLQKFLPYILIYSTLIAVAILLTLHASRLYSIREELLFTINHANLVKPIREMYETEHKNADAKMTQLLLGK